jgi:hypothetical protein
MVMALNMYAMLTATPFLLPISPGDTPTYVRASLAGEPVNITPLTRTEQATIDSTFARRKHYFLSMQNIERACFTALDSSVNDAFKLSNLAGVHGWHAGMTTVMILDQLSFSMENPLLPPSKPTKRFFVVHIQPLMPPKSSSDKSRIVRKLRRWMTTRTPTS